jgi:predicted nucleic acid-binding protein
LIATVATRGRASLLHNDRDFDVLARHSKLKIERVRAA